MRALVAGVVALLACSHSPQQQTSARTRAHDAGLEIQDAAHGEPAVDARESDVQRALFDWDTQRKKQDDARAARAKVPQRQRCKPDPNDPHKDPCTTAAGAIAALGRVAGNRDAGSTSVRLLLDVGSEDGVTGSHWAAVIDDEGRRLTKFYPVQGVGKFEANVEVANAEFPLRVRVALLPAPPAAERSNR